MTAYNRAVLMIVIGGLFLSILGIGTRLMESASGLQVVFYRAVGLAVFSTISVAIYNRGKLLQAFINAGRIGFIAGFFLSLASITVVMALVNTTAANAMFVISLAPLITAVFAWVALGERVAVRTWGAILVALLGVLIIVNGAISGEGLLGIAYALLMAVCYALFNVSLRFGKDVDMLPTVCWSSYILVLVLGFSLDDLSVPTNDLVICLALGVLQIGLGGFLLILGSKHVPAAQLSLLAMLEVVFNPIWVWLGVGEEPALATLIGGGFIMLAIAYEALAAKGPSHPAMVSKV